MASCTYSVEEEDPTDGRKERERRGGGSGGHEIEIEEQPDYVRRFGEESMSPREMH